jgi:hypothetical protein
MVLDNTNLTRTQHTNRYRVDTKPPAVALPSLDSKIDVIVHAPACIVQRLKQWLASSRDELAGLAQDAVDILVQLNLKRTGPLVFPRHRRLRVGETKLNFQVLVCSRARGSWRGRGPARCQRASGLDAVHLRCLHRGGTQLCTRRLWCEATAPRRLCCYRSFRGADIPGLQSVGDVA